ncbi:hypothetical protein INR77_02745 [Erythrobacter sp. SCSIO 43205]|uniref:hypothetical protein n=1 Tax=Erythrobacter sp. SCSIO 43205 TaxID=2779361 RepID=UPI001CA9EAC5|nr:hypothetical protein [Erythrobacter sp. SCSIO 43205]UAB78666.1 hypothetical protein INR77_02745 [Erythrobacter sp. SCSIO 43205]
MIRFTATTARAALTRAAALTFLAASPVMADDASGEEPGAELSKGEARLAKMLEGREAGEPVNCINSLGHQRITTIDGTAYVYGRGNTIYVQRTTRPQDIDQDDVLVLRRFNGSQICRQDTANTLERYSGFLTGVVRFEDFVPYTRIEKASEDAR